MGSRQTDFIRGVSLDYPRSSDRRRRRAIPRSASTSSSRCSSRPRLIGQGLSQRREAYASRLWLLLGIAALVLVIAGTSLANLLAASVGAQARDREPPRARRIARPVDPAAAARP